MTTRITKFVLEQMIDTLNRITGSPLKAWETVDGNLTANVGHYFLQGAYGGWQVQKIVTDGGGTVHISEGYKSKREVYEFLRAYMDGIVEGVKVANKEPQTA